MCIINNFTFTVYQFQDCMKIILLKFLASLKTKFLTNSNFFEVLRVMSIVMSLREEPFVDLSDFLSRCGPLNVQRMIVNDCDNLFQRHHFFDSGFRQIVVGIINNDLQVRSGVAGLFEVELPVIEVCGIVDDFELRAPDNKLSQSYKTWVYTVIVEENFKLSKIWASIGETDQAVWSVSHESNRQRRDLRQAVWSASVLGVEEYFHFEFAQVPQARQGFDVVKVRNEIKFLQFGALGQSVRVKAVGIYSQLSQRFLSGFDQCLELGTIEIAGRLDGVDPRASKSDFQQICSKEVTIIEISHIGISKIEMSQIFGILQRPNCSSDLGCESRFIVSMFNRQDEFGQQTGTEKLCLAQPDEIFTQNEGRIVCDVDYPDVVVKGDGEEDLATNEAFGFFFKTDDSVWSRTTNVELFNQSRSFEKLYCALHVDVVVQVDDDVSAAIFAQSFEPLGDQGNVLQEVARRKIT